MRPAGLSTSPGALFLGPPPKARPGQLDRPLLRPRRRRPRLVGARISVLGRVNKGPLGEPSQHVRSAISNSPRRQDDEARSVVRAAPDLQPLGGEAQPFSDIGRRQELVGVTRRGPLGSQIGCPPVEMVALRRRLRCPQTLHRDCRRSCRLIIENGMVGFTPGDRLRPRRRLFCRRRPAEQGDHRCFSHRRGPSRFVSLREDLSRAAVVIEGGITDFLGFAAFFF